VASFSLGAPMHLRNVKSSPRRMLVTGSAFALGLLLAAGGAGAAHAAGSVQAAIGLGTLDSFEVLGHTTVTNTGATTITNGDLGLSPGTSVTGIAPVTIANGVVHATDAQSELAQADLTTAFNDAAGRVPDVSNLIDLAGLTLAPGVYAGDALSLSGTVTLAGSASSVFIFQAASTLITASSSTVAFSGGANACNVFWQVGSSATLGSGSVFAGTILAQTSITADTAATVAGRLLASTGAVTLDSNVITRPSDCAARTAIVASTPTAAQTAAAAAAAQAAAEAAAAEAAAQAAATATPTPLPTTQSRTTRPVTELAATGIDIAPVLIGVGALLGIGLLLVLIGRSRRARRLH